MKLHKASGKLEKTIWSTVAFGVMQSDFYSSQLSRVLELLPRMRTSLPRVQQALSEAQDLYQAGINDERIGRLMTLLQQLPSLRAELPDHVKELEAKVLKAVTSMGGQGKADTCPQKTLQLLSEMLMEASIQFGLDSTVQQVQSRVAEEIQSRTLAETFTQLKETGLQVEMQLLVNEAATAEVKSQALHALMEARGVALVSTQVPSETMNALQKAANACCVELTKSLRKPSLLAGGYGDALSSAAELCTEIVEERKGVVSLLKEMALLVVMHDSGALASVLKGVSGLTASKALKVCETKMEELRKYMRQIMKLESAKVQNQAQVAVDKELAEAVKTVQEKCQQPFDDFVGFARQQCRDEMATCMASAKAVAGGSSEGKLWYGEGSSLSYPESRVGCCRIWGSWIDADET